MRKRIDRARILGSIAAALCLLGTAVASADDRQGDDNSDPQDWTTFNYDRLGTRNNTAEKRLNKHNVAGLHVLWQFNTPAPVTGTPIVVNDVVYAGDISGKFYALTKDGALLWSFQGSGPVTGSAIYSRGMLVYGDIYGTLYGLKPATGAKVWSFKPDTNPSAAIYSSAIQVGKYVVFGIGSNEETYARDPNFPCCSSRGSVVMLDPKTGAVAWMTPTITDAERATGASGATVWSSPTYDPQHKLIMVTTGNNFTAQTTALSDAFVALDSDTGVIQWVNQRTAGDWWNGRYPFSPANPDWDFSDSPQVYKVKGRTVVGAGQKSGFYHVVDAATGATINQIGLEPSGAIGGLFADSAVADGVAFINGINWPGAGSGGAPVGGDLFAVSGDGSHVLWEFNTPGAPAMSGVAVANSVVYFSSMGGNKLYALDQATGAKLAEVGLGATTTYSGESGPSVSRGRIYLGTGDAVGLFFQGMPSGGSITAVGP